MKRGFVALGAAMVIALPAPAFGQTATKAKIANLGNGQVLTGTVGVRGIGEASTGVKKVEVFIGGSSVAKTTPSGMVSSAEANYSWNTSNWPNASYTIRADVASNSGSAQATVNVRVDNAPGTPSGVTASASGGSISVSWSANPEPDISGYRVERDSGSGFAPVGQVGGTSYSESPSPGTYSYRVVALRPSSTSSSPKQSGPSAAASVTLTASAAGGGGSGGGAGGSKGGSGSGSGGGSKGGSGNKGGAGAAGGGGKAGNGKTGSGGFLIGGRSFGPRGLPRLATLTIPGGGRPSIPELSRPTNGSPDLGGFEGTLPYDLSSLSSGGRTEVEQLGFDNVAARSPDRVIPPDGLRWVAAGALALALAGLLLLLGLRADSGMRKKVGEQLQEIKADLEASENRGDEATLGDDVVRGGETDQAA